MDKTPFFEERRSTQKMSGIAGLPDPKGNTFRNFHEASSHLARDEFLLRYRMPFLVAPVTVDPATWDGAVVLSIEKRTKNGAPSHYLVGRDVTNDIAVVHPSVSKRHATFTFEEERWFITDAKSSNGTIVDEEEAPAHVKVKIPRDLALIELGDVRLTFMTPGAMLELFAEIKRARTDVPRTKVAFEPSLPPEQRKAPPPENPWWQQGAPPTP